MYIHPSDHASLSNKAVSYTHLHQYLIQWVDEDVEVVHGDTSACVAVADGSTMSMHDHVRCLSGLDLFDYEMISCTRDGFVPAVLKPVEYRLNHLV